MSDSGQLRNETPMQPEENDDVQEIIDRAIPKTADSAEIYEKAVDKMRKAASDVEELLPRKAARQCTQRKEAMLKERQGQVQISPMSRESAAEYQGGTPSATTRKPGSASHSSWPAGKSDTSGYRGVEGDEVDEDEEDDVEPRPARRRGHPPGIVATPAAKAGPSTPVQPQQPPKSLKRKLPDLS